MLTPETAAAAPPIFTEHELRVLTAICDTFVPAVDDVSDSSGFYKRKASDLNVPAMLADMLPIITGSANIIHIKLVLWLLDQPWFNGLLDRNMRSLLEMSLEERTGLLLDWAESSI